MDTDLQVISHVAAKCLVSQYGLLHLFRHRCSDPTLPKEEESREYGITLPFGTKSPESFADAENFIVVTTPDKPLYASAQTCSQGLHNDESWNCTHLEESHRVCGHLGVFTFLYPNFRVKETDKFIRMYVQRSGGGSGAVEINYFIKHFTTNDSDLIATAPYTTVQRLFFGEGMAL